MMEYKEIVWFKFDSCNNADGLSEYFDSSPSVFLLQATGFLGWDWIKRGLSQVNPMTNLNVLNVLGLICQKKICNFIYGLNVESHRHFSVLNVPTKVTVASLFKCTLKDFMVFREALSLYNSSNEMPKVCGKLQACLHSSTNRILCLYFSWFGLVLSFI